MKRYKKFVLAVPFGLIDACVFSMVAISEEGATITGTINEDYQLIANDGKIYILAEPEKIADLDETIGKKVTVTGNIEESEGFKIITIASYRVIEE